MTRLVFSFTHLGPTDDGTLVASFTVSSTWSINNVVVANITPTIPTIKYDNTTLSSDSALLTIHGRGFEAFASVKNIVKFQATKGESVKGILASNATSYTKTTRTTLVVSFTHLSPFNGDGGGELNASVTVSGT